jgi:NCS1 family nucleobase:cation symporter-1
MVAITAFVLGVLPSLPGFLIKISVLDTADVPPVLMHLYDYAWFVGFAIAFVVYLALRKLSSKADASAALPFATTPS